MRRILVALTLTALTANASAALAQTDPYSGGGQPGSTLAPSTTVATQQTVASTVATQQTTETTLGAEVREVSLVQTDTLPQTGIETTTLVLVAVGFVVIGGLAVWVPRRLKARQ